jgi:hypothetical protein
MTEIAKWQRAHIAGRGFYSKHPPTHTHTH